jgi:hypothetical protein
MKYLGRFVFWDFPRGSWQYDVMVALILGFVWFTPRWVFRDQPRAASVVMLPGEGPAGSFFIEKELLAGVPESEWVNKANALVKKSHKSTRPVAHVQPLYDSEDQIIAYAASTQP